MSDSLVLYSGPIEPDSPTLSQELTSAVLVGRTVMLKLFEFHLPARGAISLGEFYADAGNPIFCGKALVEAYEVAEAQEWIGMSICDSLDSYMDTLVASFSIESFAKTALVERRWNLLRPGWDIIRYDVPFKACTQQRWVVSWSSAWNFGGPVREDFFEAQLTGSDGVDRKYRNTLAYLQWFHETAGPPGLPVSDDLTMQPAD